MSIKAHFGDPRIYCFAAHDEVAPGPCPGNPGARDKLERLAWTKFSTRDELHVAATDCEMAAETVDVAGWVINFLKFPT